MVLKKKQIDITESVIGKIENGEMNLYSGNEHIGKLEDTEDGLTYRLNEGYETDNRSIYHLADVTENPDMKYTDCDQGGWC
ncbi:YusG family protein [Peribacillus sp. SCS-37]|uniref:YusG family protein n=1 Tax=Paraperibacillus esterisolvens TaxID=3115296 RepID=UPI003905D65D